MKSITVRHLNKLMSLMLCTILVGLLCVGAWAQTEAHCQLMIDYRYEDMAVSEASFRIYPIANFNDEQELEYTAAFSDLQLDKDALVDAAELLYARIEERGLLSEQIVTTDHHGKASFSSVPAGVFLLVCEPTEMDGFVYHVENQVIVLREDITLCPKSTKLPAGEQMISLKVVKRWDDQGYEHKRPTEISVRLLKDGKTFSTVTLSDANGWSHTWNDLLPNARWTVEEDVPKGYKASVENPDGVFILTNQYKDIPQTGHIWWPVIAVLFAGLVLIVVGLSLRRGGRHET